MYVLETRHGPDDASASLQIVRSKLVDRLIVGAVVGSDIEPAMASQPGGRLARAINPVVQSQSCKGEPRHGKSTPGALRGSQNRSKIALGSVPGHPEAPK